MFDLEARRDDCALAGQKASQRQIGNAIHRESQMRIRPKFLPGCYPRKSRRRASIRSLSNLWLQIIQEKVSGGTLRVHRLPPRVQLDRTRVSREKDPKWLEGTLEK